MGRFFKRFLKLSSLNWLNQPLNFLIYIINVLVPLMNVTSEHFQIPCGPECSIWCLKVHVFLNRYYSTMNSKYPGLTSAAKWRSPCLHTVCHCKTMWACLFASYIYVTKIKITNKNKICSFMLPTKVQNSSHSVCKKTPTWTFLSCNQSHVGCFWSVPDIWCSLQNNRKPFFCTYSRRADVWRSGKVQHAVFAQDSLSLRVHERQGVDDDAQDGRGLLLAFHTHQLQEVPSVREGEEDELCGLTKHPGVVGGQRHLVGVPEDRRRKSESCLKRWVDKSIFLCCDIVHFEEIQLRRHLYV